MWFPSVRASADLLELRIGAVGAPEYWLDAEADASAALSKLDAFLRKIWLECCGHMSMFSIPPCTYSSWPGGMSGPFGRANNERSMRSTIGDAFSHDGQKGTYDYDFGSTTRLGLARIGIRVGRIDKWLLMKTLLAGRQGFRRFGLPPFASVCRCWLTLAGGAS